MSTYCDSYSTYSAKATVTTNMTVYPTTANKIRSVIDTLNLDDVSSYFNKNICPYIICDGVSVDEFNKYVGDGERLRIALRFLCHYNDGRIGIVELPTRVHETTVREFKCNFLRATGNGNMIGIGGAMTARINGRPNKEADSTFGPKGNTRHQTTNPPPGTLTDWVTLEWRLEELRVGKVGGSCRMVVRLPRDRVYSTVENQS